MTNANAVAYDCPDDTLKVNLSLDFKRFTKKPDKSTTIKINNRIASYQGNYELGKLAQIVGELGYSWCPSTFSEGKRKKANFNSQQIFGLDFDNGITWEEVQNRATKYRLPIAFAYETFSSINKSKFRVVLCNDVEITDSRAAKIIQLALMDIFPECDPICKDCSRLFFGGKNLFYVNDNIDTVFNISDLMVSLVEYYRDKDNINYLRLVKKYAERVGIELKNGYPRIEIRDIEQKSEISGASPLIYIYRKCPPDFNFSEAENLCYAVYLTEKIKKIKSVKTKEGQEKVITYQAVNTKIGKRDLLRNFDFSDLMNKCQLYSEFTKGERWYYYSELWGMATNLCQIKGGGDKFIKIIQNEQNEKYHSYAEKDWGYYINYIQKLDYLPQQCMNFCPYADNCDHAKNMILTAKTKRNTIVELANDIKYVPLDEVEKDLADKFLSAQVSKDNDIHVIVAQTGSGKSKTYIEMIKNADKPYIIAVPTHKLKDEIYDKCVARGYNVIKTPVLPGELPTEVRREIERLYELGATHTAGKYIRKIAELKNLPELIQYIEELDNVKNFEGHIIITHDRLLYFRDEQFSTHNVIIDEDIIKTLLKINSVKIKDLLKIQQSKYITTFDEDLVKEKFKQIAIDNDYKTFVKVEPIDLLNKGRFEIEVTNTQNGISSNVIGFLKSSVAYRYNLDSDQMTVKGFYSDSDIIQYIVKHNLPNQKIIIMSATANELIYNKMFGNRVKFYYCKEAKYQGNLIQYPKKSFSRECIKNDDKLMDNVKKIVGDIPIITFKSFKENETDLNFGGVEGHNCNEGQDIAVVGTPHLNEVVYKMYGAALDIDISDCQMKYQEIKWNHYKFWFMTYDNKELRKIQLGLIESELEQATGRARLLRNDCSVFLFSNFPLKQAKFKH